MFRYSGDHTRPFSSPQVTTAATSRTTGWQRNRRASALSRDSRQRFPERSTNVAEPQRPYQRLRAAERRVCASVMAKKRLCFTRFDSHAFCWLDGFAGFAA